MCKNLLLKSIENVWDIYTFITVVYEFIMEVPKQSIESKYKQMLNDGSKKKFLDEITNLVRNLCVINQFEFNDWLNCWVEKFEKSEIDYMVFCYVTLLKIDDEICSLLPCKRTVVSKGPLNNGRTSFFYYKKQHGYFDNKLEKGKIRSGRQTVLHESNAINRNFNNFEVLQTSCLYNYTPKVKQYNHKFDLKKEIKIGVTAISDKIWFVPHFNKSERVFTVDYDPENIQSYNGGIKERLLEFEKAQVDIVVFPELAMNVETEQEIKNFIINSKFQYIKLFFLGSVWNNNTNECVLLSNQGTVLMREKKQIPYKRYIKDINDYCTESIVGDKKINFIDIDGIGRIAYLICADYNDDSINAICSLLNVDFIVVSAYTNDTTLMKETALGHASRKAITTILANSCAALTDSDKCKSFIVIPRVEASHLKSEMYIKDTICDEGIVCDSCIDTFVINQD